MDYDFEWDATKATENASKHGVMFEEAATILLDAHQSRASGIAAHGQGRVWYAYNSAVGGNSRNIKLVQHLIKIIR